MRVTFHAAPQKDDAFFLPGRRPFAKGHDLQLQMTSKTKATTAAIDNLNDAVDRATSILAIGPLDQMETAIGAARAARITTVAYRLLTGATLAALKPDLVLSPLLAAGFDILDVADRLASMGFSERLRALTPPLPDPVAVAGEVRAQFGLLDFALIELATAGSGAA